MINYTYFKNKFKTNNIFKKLSSCFRIDDIEDNSKLRRGIPVAHHIFGVPSTINSANYVYFLGLEKTLNLGHPEATRVFTGISVFQCILIMQDDYKKIMIYNPSGQYIIHRNNGI